MAEKIDSIISIIKKYTQEVAHHTIVIDKHYLFGSYASGTASENSDIDVAIVSKDFMGDRFLDRRTLIPLRRKIDRRIEPIPYRPEDFSESDPLAAEILRNGIEIK